MATAATGSTAVRATISVGTVAGTIGVGGTLDGFAELVKAKDISRSFEVTPGAS
jgi:hypothetical protein